MLGKAVMATQQDVSARHCVIIQLSCCDEERILKYLYEDVHVYSWILREDKEIGMVRLCVWWRESDYKLFSTSPLRSFLKRLKNKAGYEKISISKPLTTKVGVHVLCNGDLQCISKYYTEGLLYKYLREVLSLELSQTVESSPKKRRSVTIYFRWPLVWTCRPNLISYKNWLRESYPKLNGNWIFISHHLKKNPISSKIHPPC